MRPEQNGHQFANNIFLKLYLFKRQFVLNEISLKLYPSGRVDDMSALVQAKTVTNKYLDSWWWYVRIFVQCHPPYPNNAISILVRCQLCIETACMPAGQINKIPIYIIAGKRLRHHMPSHLSTWLILKNPCHQFTHFSNMFARKFNETWKHMFSSWKIIYSWIKKILHYGLNFHWIILYFNCHSVTNIEWLVVIIISCARQSTYVMLCNTLERLRHFSMYWSLPVIQ